MAQKNQWSPPGIISQSKAQNVLEPLHGRLYQTVQNAWASYQEAVTQRTGVSPRWRAITMHQCMTEHARELFDSVNSVTLFEGDRFLLLIADTLLLQFKKLDPELRTRNYPTRSASLFDRQLPLSSLPSPTLPRVTLGYQPKSDWTSLLAVTLVHRVGRSEPHWYYDIESPQEQAIPQVGGGLPESIIVRPRKQQPLFGEVANIKPKR